MPHLHSTYQAPTGLNNGHLQTLIANFRRVAPLPTQRERIFTDDQDFLDLDWYCKGSSRLALLSHGLEGHSQRPYMIGMAQTLSEQGWDVLLWNYRSCSGELNWKVSLYHSGATEDLHHVLQHVLQRKNYKTLILIGFSLGGNLALKYLGQYPLPSILRTGIFFSVPCDLKAASEQLAKPAQRLYMQEFLRSFHQKIRQKSKKNPHLLSDQGYSRIKNFKQFDERYTAPLHGFKNALDYWEKSSCKAFLPQIPIPVLIVNAQNDPFLAPPCYPILEAQHSSTLFLETPASGGHLGFLPNPLQSSRYWSEQRTLAFLRDQGEGE